MNWIRSLVVVGALACLSGCHTVRAEVGVAFGIGADVQFSGLVRGGAMAMPIAFSPRGTVYGKEPFSSMDAGWGYTFGPAFWRMEPGWRASKPVRREAGVGLFHGVTHRFCPENLRAHPWAFELQLVLLVFQVRVGWDPMEFLGHDALPSESLESPRAGVF